ncbi:hypothetical protein DYE50_03205 [Treponema ruminis]|uniref:SPOR domain-containing protein n=1 Tax=Treponema ruminis TaxID=744515 RepID=A0A7W8G8A7_9SPIR|nr:SPOR domain-containing protein [Treponema ruminis]MBB5225546.1 hypothetical protein [Treponema ruminis]QSI01585.1 hypothetical protein DYE50_03205 [Treponema ruminis]
MRKITLFILTIFTVGTLFAAARPSLDGRAVVAEGGTMPKGLFARTVGYLPGDSVTVTNPATGSTIDVLILGAIDPSEGVAILLSPEAAEGLRIKPDSNVQVKLTKRSGSLDENANGSAVLSEGDDQPAAVEESPALAENTPAESESEVEESPALAEETVEGNAPVAEKAIEEEPVEEIPVVAEKPVEEEAVEETPVVAERPVEETPVIVAATEPLVEEKPAEEEIVPETVYEELPPLPQDENLQKVVVVSADGEEAKVESDSENPVAVEEIPAAESLAETDQPVELDELPGIEEEPAVVLNESPIVDENADAYQPIVLVPAEPNPPAAEEVPVEESAPVAVELEVAPVKEEAPKVVVSNDWTNYVVPSAGNLRRGSYYIQVASLGNTDNIKSFVEKYSAKYPVVLVKNSSTYQVMVGPLNIDEYGAVGEKFKDYGFKDSFVRRIK